MPEESAKTLYPPYVPFQTFRNFIEGFATAGLPGRIDKSVMGTMSGATQSSLLLALKYLYLIDEAGKPAPELITAVQGSEADRKKLYSRLVSHRYGFLAEKGVHLETATQQQLEEAFSTTGLTGETLRKAVSFFVLLATEGELKVSTHLKSAKRKGGGNGVGRRKRRAADDLPPASAPASVLQAEPAGHRTYTLDLATDGSRMIKVTAPTDLTVEDIERLSGWMQFQFNVGWKQAKGAQLI